MSEITKITAGGVEYDISTSESEQGYCKLADGTLMCWGKYSGGAITELTPYGSMYSADINCNISFPVTFTATPVITFAPSGNPFSMVAAGVSASATGIARVTVCRPDNSWLYPNFSWFAIGRWKA